MGSAQWHELIEREPLYVGVAPRLLALLWHRKPPIGHKCHLLQMLDAFDLVIAVAHGIFLIQFFVFFWFKIAFFVMTTVNDSLSIGRYCRLMPNDRTPLEL